MKILKKVWNYIKENKFYVAVMIIGTAMFLAQMNFVVLYADDLFLGNIAKSGMVGAIEHLAFNYMNWGGGPTPFIAIIFLFFDIKVWKIFNCIMIVTSIILIVKMITYNIKVNKGIIAVILWLCIYALNIYISAETLYWLDGNLAYVLTAFQMLIYFYYLFSRLVMKTTTKKYDVILLPLVAFFAGWTGPQSGAITVIISVLLLLWVKLINKEKIKPIYIVSTIFGLIGFLVYYLAPGNNARMIESFPVFAEYNLFEKIFYRLDSVWKLLFYFVNYKFASIPCYLYLVIAFMSIISMRFALTEKNIRIARIIKILSSVIIIFIILNFIIIINCDQNSILTNSLLKFEPILENLNNGTFRLKMLVPYTITAGIMVFTVILSYYVSFKEKNPLLFLVFTCALLGQGMMLLSPYSPLRSTFITVFLLWIAIAYLVNLIIKNNISVIWIVGTILAIMHGIKIAVIIAVVYLLFKSICCTEENKAIKCERIILIGIFTILILNSYIHMLSGYKINKDVYDYNMKQIQEFKDNRNENNTLYLKEPQQPIYGFTPLIGTEWVEEAVKDYFELGDVKLLPELENK